jgi:TonB family protein
MSWVKQLLLGAFLLASASVIFGGDKKHDAAELVARAKEASDLRAPGRPPFHLDGTLQILRSGQPPLNGTFAIDWAEPEAWRQEYVIGDYRELRVSSDGHEWWQHTPPYEPFVVAQISMGLWHYPQQIPGAVDKIQSQTDGGRDITCAKTRSVYGKGEYCVDAATGRLILDGGVPSFEYSDFVQVDAKWFPRTVRVLLRGTLVAEARVAQVSTKTTFDPARFAEPSGPGVFDLSDCKGGNLQKAVVAYHPNPPYPARLRQMREQGAVSMWAVIGADGKLYDPTVLQSAGSDLDAIALSTVRQWRYSPTSCKGMPVDVQTVVTVNFGLH